MSVNQEEVCVRAAIWGMANDLIKPIVEQHGLEIYGTGPGPFVQSYKSTAVDQHIDHVLRVADWLMGKEV